jgi:peptide/nickel transport system substrate-binding protein
VTNTAKAKALLAQAGYPNGFTVTLTYPTNYNFDGINFDALAAKLINDLKGVGITVTPKAEQVSVALAEYRAKKSQINLEPWGADFPDAYDNLYYFGPGGGEGVRVNYVQDDGLPALIAKGDATADAATRGAIYNKVQQQLLKTGPWAVLVQPEFPVGLRSNIKGFQYAPIWKVDVASLSE